MSAETLFDKIWDRHVVADLGDGYSLLHVSRHLMHDGGSEAFKSLKKRGLPVRSPELTFATFDHVISTLPGRTAETNPALTPRLYSMRADAKASGVRLFDLGQPGQGIVHVIGPELGITLPGYAAGVRRQPHLHARRHGRARIRHRLERGGARAGDADHRAAPAEEAARHLRWHARRTASPPRT